MTIFAQIQTISAATSNSDRGAVKKFILALMSYAKHTGQKLTNAQIATLTKQYIPEAKTTAGSVADYKNKLNSGLFDYYPEAEAKAILASFEQAEAAEAEAEAEAAEAAPVAPWSATDLVYKARAKAKRAAKAKTK